MNVRGLVFVALLSFIAGEEGINLEYLSPEKRILNGLISKQCSSNFKTPPLKKNPRYFLRCFQSAVKLRKIQDLKNAIILLGFHRSKMYEYMASNFIRRQIQNILNYPSNFSSNVLKVRRGYAESPIGLKKKIDLNFAHLLFKEEGSKEYLNWLKKTSGQGSETVEPFLQLAQKFHRKDGTTNPSNRIKRLTSIPNSNKSANNRKTSFDYGDISGLFFKTNNMNTSQIQPSFRFYPDNNDTITSELKNKRDLWRSNEMFRTSMDNKKPSKELNLRDITDIALTTFAFLSFGMFTLQVLICITMTKEDTTNFLEAPLGNTGFIEIPSEAVEEIRGNRRLRRSIETRENTVKMVNGLTRNIIYFIEKIIVHGKKRDVGCEHWILWFEEEPQTGAKLFETYWVTLWSFGRSWVDRNISPDSGLYTVYKFLRKNCKQLRGY